MEATPAIISYTTRDIVAKLRKHFAVTIRDEPARVVYLLCEVRKLLERARPNPKPFALWMFCHWALHVDLRHSKTALEFLQHADNFGLNTVAKLAGNVVSGGRSFGTAC